jgi:hypothetical protein
MQASPQCVGSCALNRLGEFLSRMLRRCSCVIGLAVMLVGLPTAQAADTTLMLTCKGTANMTTSTGDSGDTGPVSMGLVVDLTTRTVHGFREQFGTDGSEAQLKITEVKEAILILRGILRGSLGSIVDLSGFMDRMTGDMTVTATQRPPGFTKTYSLKCTPAQRMF